MAANDFGTAIYTNCAPDQGLDGIAGMQFQSRSEGVDREMLAAIRRHLLYEPPDQLIQEGQPIDAFPPSFAHVHDGVFATAAGVYIGSEAVGSRQGNHLTSAIVAADARAYRAVRPVQLFHAPFWQTEPVASKQSERLGLSWQPGTYDAGRAGQFVRDQRDGQVLLAAILTALLAHLRPAEGINPRRVLFISEQADLVLLWLTAATLLIPQQEAVRLGFKVFTTDPAASDLPVVAVHPGWVRSAATVENDRGYVVFDLVKHSWSAVEITVEAKHWAQWFCQADPYEVVEAMELAQASGLTGQTGRDLAAVAVLRQEPSPDSAGQLARWLRTGPLALREAYGGTLAAALVKSHDLSVLQEVDSAADGQFPARRDQVRLSLLRLELNTALRNPIMFQPDRPRRPVSAAIAPEAVRLATGMLHQARGPAFDAVLRVTNRFGIAVPPDTIHQPILEFVGYWADNPDAGYEPSGWPASLPINDMLRNALSARISDEPGLASRWYKWLPSWAPDTADLTSPLERSLLSAAMANSSYRERMRIVRNVLRPSGSAISPRHQDLVGLLFREIQPTTDEIRELCKLVPVGERLDPAIFASVLADARGDPAGVPELELCGTLAEQHRLELDSETKKLLADHRWLVESERKGSLVTAPGAADYLLRISPGLLNAHADTLRRALGAASDRDPVQVKRLLDWLPRPVVVAYLREFGRYELRPFSPAEVALIVAGRALLTPQGDGRDQPPPDDPVMQVRRNLGETVSRWRLQASKRSIAMVGRYLQSFGGGLAMTWDRDTAEMSRSRLRRKRTEPGR